MTKLKDSQWSDNYCLKGKKKQLAMIWNFRNNLIYSYNFIFFLRAVVFLSITENDWFPIFMPERKKVKSLSRVQLCYPVEYSPPDSSVYGIFQARILEWVAISFSRGSSQPRDQTQLSRIAGRCFNLWATREALTFCHILLAFLRYYALFSCLTCISGFSEWQQRSVIFMNWKY